MLPNGDVVPISGVNRWSEAAAAEAAEAMVEQEVGPAER